MANETKARFLTELRTRYGAVAGLPGSQSLYSLEGGRATVYVRYSRVHEGGRTFYGLREQDIRRMEGRPAAICFLWDTQEEPLFVSLADYEEVLRSVHPAEDGQYKAQVYLGDMTCELYIARAGRFNVERSFGWNALEQIIGSSHESPMPELSHPQVQTLIGSIGHMKGMEVWIPRTDRADLDWSVAPRFECRLDLPRAFDMVRFVAEEVDVLWLRPGDSAPRALFEIEHTSPVYSGLLRLNDVHLASPSWKPTFAVVAARDRRPLFVKHLNRPTFQASGLDKACSFLAYDDVYGWHNRLSRERSGATTHDATEETGALGGG